MLLALSHTLALSTALALSTLGGSAIHIPRAALTRVIPRSHSVAPGSAIAFWQDHEARVRHAMTIFAPASTHDRNSLEAKRERDELKLYGPAIGNKASTATGIAIFGAFTLAAAHAPKPLRAVFDAPIHLGPAILEDGAMGVAVGARF